MTDWAKGTIGDFFDLDPGYAFNSVDFIDAGVPVIKIKNIKAGHFSEHEFSYVSAHFLALRANKLAKPGDLLISMSGNRHDGSPETWVGKIALFKKDGNFFINQRVGALRRKVDTKIDVRFASFLLSSFPDIIRNCSCRSLLVQGDRLTYLHNKYCLPHCRIRPWKHRSRLAKSSEPLTTKST